MGSLGRRAAAAAAAVALTLSAGADDTLAKSVNITIDSGWEKHIVTCPVIHRVLHPRYGVTIAILRHGERPLPGPGPGLAHLRAMR